MCYSASIRTSSHSQMGKITLSSSEKTIIGNCTCDFNVHCHFQHFYLP